MTRELNYRVTGDHMRLVYSSHATEAAARKAAARLQQKWGWSHPGSEPAVERLTTHGWVRIQRTSGLDTSSNI